MCSNWGMEGTLDLHRTAAGASPAERVRAVVAELAGVDGAGWSDLDRLAAVTALEELKGACAAAQARLTVAFAASQGVPLTMRTRPGPAMVGVRRGGRVVGWPRWWRWRGGSPRRVGTSTWVWPRRWCGEMPLLHGSVDPRAGAASGWRPGWCRAPRRCPGRTGRRPMRGWRRCCRGWARRVPLRPPGGSRLSWTRRGGGRGWRPRSRSRRVTVRPAPDGMAYLTVLAPLVETVGAFAALGRDADAVVGGHGCRAGRRSVAAGR